MAEWKRVKLGEVADIRTGKLNSCAAVDNGKYPFFTCAEKPLMIDTPAYDSESVLVAGNCTPYINYYKGKFNAYQRTYIITPTSDGIFCRWLYYWMKKQLDFMIHRQQGSVEKYFVLSDFTDAEIPLPPLPTQRKIAAVLGALDDKIENNRKICANLEAQAQALFRNSDRGPEIEFTSEINVLGGGTPKTSEPKYWGGDIPFFSPKDVGSPYVTSTERTITSEGLNNCNSELYPAETTFVTARGTVGKVCLTGLPMAMNQSCFALRSQSIDPLLVYFYTKASISSLKNKANGSVFDAITVAEFETEKLCRLTRPSESRFLSVARPMFDEILRRTRESTNLASLRDALLPKLMSGEIDVEKVEV